MWLWHPLRPDIVPRWGNRRSRGRRWPRWGESNIVSQRRRKATSIATAVEAIIAWGSIRWYVDQWAIWAKMSSMSVLIDRTWPLTTRCWRRWSRSSSSWSSKTTSTLYWIYRGNINVGYIIVFYFIYIICYYKWSSFILTVVLVILDRWGFRLTFWKLDNESKLNERMDRDDEFKELPEETDETPK